MQQIPINIKQGYNRFLVQLSPNILSKHPKRHIAEVFTDCEAEWVDVFRYLNCIIRVKCPYDSSSEPISFSICLIVP